MTDHLPPLSGRGWFDLAAGIAIAVIIAAAIRAW